MIFCLSLLVSPLSSLTKSRTVRPVQAKSSSRAMCAAIYRPKRSTSYQWALVGSHAHHLRQPELLDDISTNRSPFQEQERVRCGLNVVKSPAICTKRPCASSSTELAE